VCLTAFLYLEHVTLYQMKRLRKHLQNHGVTPRTHGNHGRKPSNTLPLDIYQHAMNFVQKFIDENQAKHLHSDSSKSKTNPSKFPADITKKTLHNEYVRFCQSSAPLEKVMQYSTFTTFIKKQFPMVRFKKCDKFISREELEGQGRGKKRIRNKIAPVVGPLEVVHEIESGPTEAANEEEEYVVVDGDSQVFVY